jgi:cytochrome c oxidase cbb3-type subunit 3
MATDRPQDAPPLVPDADDYPDQVIKGHKYDGIREYDNPMPGWWVWLFWASIAFSVVYVLGLHVFDMIDTREEDLAESVAQLEAVRTAYAEANPTFEVSNEALAAYVGDPAMVEAGATIYTAQCAACHGQEGQGLIGPNLVDEYWLHGHTNEDIFHVLTTGVLDKGMPAWESILSPEERAQLVAYIRSIQGTEPPNAKEPQGEPVAAS